MMEDTEEIKRVRYFEGLYDQLSALFDQMEQSVEQVQDELPQLSQLVTYYDQEWREDYEADERGLFPDHLKRGVLSQDGIFDLLATKVSLSEQLRQLADRLDEV